MVKIPQPLSPQIYGDTYTYFQIFTLPTFIKRCNILIPKLKWEICFLPYQLFSFDVKKELTKEYFEAQFLISKNMK